MKPKPMAPFAAAAHLVCHPRALLATTLIAAIPAALYALPAPEQDPVPLAPGRAQFMDGSLAARQLPKRKPGAAAGLPIWNYQVTSPVDGNTYNGYMVGQSPFDSDEKTTTIPVVLIPVIVKFHNTNTGFTAIFDPTSTPDAGCTASRTAFSLVEKSPIFQNNPWTINGVYIGNTQYIDAFQRANFWQQLKHTKPNQTEQGYHTLLSYTVGSPLTLTFEYSDSDSDPSSPNQNPAHKVYNVSPGSCTNPTMPGATNAAGYTGAGDINVVDAALNDYIAAHGITANQFPVFITYNFVMSIPDNPGFFAGGYHATQTPYPQSLTSPGQTYAIAGFQINDFFYLAGNNQGTPGLSHEIAEWLDDPGGGNATPAWGNIGQVSGCQGNLEVGDPLTATNLPGIAGPNGFTYYLQELVFASWFFRTPSLAAGGLFSDNGTFTTDAGAVCH